MNRREELRFRVLRCSHHKVFCAIELTNFIAWSDNAQFIVHIVHLFINKNSIVVKQVLL